MSAYEMTLVSIALADGSEAIVNPQAVAFITWPSPARTGALLHFLNGETLFARDVPSLVASRLLDASRVETTPQ